MRNQIYTMTQFNFDLPDTKHDEIIDAWCIQEGYSLMTPGDGGVMVENPESKLEFAKRTVKEKMQDAYIRNAAELARIAATQAAQSEI